MRKIFKIYVNYSFLPQKDNPMAEHLIDVKPEDIMLF